MRSYQVFAAMRSERAVKLVNAISEANTALHAQALAAASAAMKARPVYLLRQPPEKRAEAVRRALSRVAASDVAEELLAAYFLESRRELLVEWLDALGIQHDEGTLEEDPKPPGKAKLQKTAKEFLEKDGDEDRELLLRAFAAQSAVEWPDLEALFGERF